ncbi:MAG TPA: hypothetical protein VIO33_14725, partial [Burkholderiaceae bacterium]
RLCSRAVAPNPLHMDPAPPTLPCARTLRAPAERAISVARRALRRLATLATRFVHERRLP